jgi:hypothetical protein
MAPLIMTLGRVFRLHSVTGFVEFGFLQAEASRRVEGAVCLDIVKKQVYFMVCPAATCLFRTARS